MPNISATTGPAAESLDGTRTSRRWQEQPGSWDTVNTRAIYPAANEWGVPDLPAAAVEPARLVSYADRYACDTAKPGDAVHAFLDDYRFEAMWTKPERPLSRLRRAGLALTPDFSLWLEMPRAVQLWQVYRSRWCGAWWLSHGITVIPTVSWAGPDSYEYAFAGIARFSVVAISTVGVIRNRDALRLFDSGYWAMITAIRPARVLCYGGWPAQVDPGKYPVTEYPTRWEGRRGRQGS